MTVVTVSTQARQHLINMLDRVGLPAVELKLEPQGCNGYKYAWQPVATNIADAVVELDEDHFLVLNHSAIPYVIGSEVVIETVGLNQKLNLVNPNAAGSCGCGESVNFKK